MAHAEAHSILGVHTQRATNHCPLLLRPSTDLIPVPQIGSNLPYLDAAVAAGYSFIVLNPNENYAGGRVRCLALHTAHGQSSPYDGGPCE